ncbi:MAG TPA: glycine cleavage system aminomethyltransferase GcvT [Steroidobacteraceae bacterium]|nr:glycine cleavage system aminomethyltransferase GcvT [Steroidobacteraceae bacterium]
MIPPAVGAESSLGRHTCLYDLHVALGARMVDFGGWDMPVAYGSQIEEHHAVRRAAGVFDVSHMGIVDLRGAHCRELLRGLLANDVGRLNLPGKALYSCMLNEHGGVIDDLIVYYLDDDFFRVVVNAGTRARDLAWIGEHAAALGVKLHERRDLAMLAIQGPQARERSAALLTAEAAWAVLELQPFFGTQIGQWFVARTGYTGEDGFEIMLPTAEAVSVWQRLNAAGVHSCGLGARDTLRLEAGMNLYGNDMDEQTNPLESGLAWTVAFDPAERDFVGRAALEAVRARGPERKLVGLVLDERAVLRSHQRVLVPDALEGEVTSGTFSPTLERSIGLARVPVATGVSVQVEVRGRPLPARVVRVPFVRHGKALISLV